MPGKSESIFLGETLGQGMRGLSGRILTFYILIIVWITWYTFVQIHLICILHFIFEREGREEEGKKRKRKGNRLIG